MHSMFIAVLFIIVNCWKQPKCPSVNEWIKNCTVVLGAINKCLYIYTTQYYPAERKKELLPSATSWTELESIILSEITQVVKD